MRKLILLLLSLFTANVFAADIQLPPKQHTLAPTVKVAMSRTKKRQMNIYYASRGSEVDNNDPGPDADDLDIYVGYRRLELININSNIDTIPDHILKRLEIARRRAVNRHREVWQTHQG